MRHLELRDLWLQREVGEGRVVVKKVAGHLNPAGAMTKFLSRGELCNRLSALGLALDWRDLPQQSGQAESAWLGQPDGGSEGRP